MAETTLAQLQVPLSAAQGAFVFAATTAGVPLQIISVGLTHYPRGHRSFRWHTSG